MELISAEVPVIYKRVRETLLNLFAMKSAFFKQTKLTKFEFVPVLVEDEEVLLSPSYLTYVFW